MFLCFLHLYWIEMFQVSFTDEIFVQKSGPELKQVGEGVRNGFLGTAKNEWENII